VGLIVIPGSRALPAPRNDNSGVTRLTIGIEAKKSPAVEPQAISVFD
jgi:hypothetical protein